MSEGADFVDKDVFHYRELNDLKNNNAGASAPTAPVAGVRWFDTGSNSLKIYRDSAFTAIGGASEVFPPGTILAWIGGYFTDGSNGGFTNVLGNTIAAANSYLNVLGWYVCNGAVPNLAASAIWSAAGRYLPNLTDDRFIMGDTVVGGIGGSSSRAHTHTVDPDTKTSGNNSDWNRCVYDAGGELIAAHTHTHDLNLAQFTTGAASVTENRPLYLSAFFIIRVL